MDMCIEKQCELALRMVSINSKISGKVEVIAFL